MSLDWVWPYCFTAAAAQRSKRGGSKAGYGEAGGRRRQTKAGDRRSRSRPEVKIFLLSGRRKSTRRDADKKDFIYVDQYRSWLLAILSISDGLFTLHLIELGAPKKTPSWSGS